MKLHNKLFSAAVVAWLFGAPVFLMAIQDVADGSLRPILERVDEHLGNAVHQEPASDESGKQKPKQREVGQEKGSHPAANFDGQSTKEIDEEPNQDNASQQANAFQKELMVQVKVEKYTYMGRLLAWDGKKLTLLRRDGQLNVLPVASESDINFSAEKFQPYSPDQMQKQLVKEFGKRHQVSTTANFVVAHPYGDPQIWAQPFEVLLKRFRYYFESRGINLEEPEFPLVVVVFRSRSEFDRHMNRHFKYDRNLTGTYSIPTNRMFTYDPKAKVRTSKRGSQFLFEDRTVMHELAHQAAFNLGIHNRFSLPPRWLNEGLSMMFETRGFNNSEFYTRLEDRVNRTRLKELKKYLKIEYFKSRRIYGKLEQLIIDDQLFETEPFIAYELAWGLTFYLSEEFPEQFFEFLKKNGEREDFQPYPPEQRRADFAKSFGSNYTQIEMGLKKFFDKF